MKREREVFQGAPGRLSPGDQDAFDANREHLGAGLMLCRLAWLSSTPGWMQRR